MEIKKIFIILIMFSCKAMEQESKWDAELYDQNSKGQYEASLKYLEDFDFESLDFKTILELGCNTANVSNKLAQKYIDKTFIGIDPEKNAINLAIQKHVNRKNLILIQDYAQKFNLKNHNLSPANLIFCYHVLHWIARNDLQLVFNKIVLNLDKNGILDIITSAKQEDTTLTKAIIKTILKFKWCPYWPYFFWKIIKGQNSLTLLTANELKQFASSSDLIVDSCEEIEALYRFDSKEEFCPWLISILKPHGIDSMAKNDQLKFASEVSDLYCAEYNPGKNGNIEYRFKELHLRAHKSNN